ncbi:MAG: Gfo/Idh/MocA family oxidoreductase [Candidatus Omnitrophica bacterium]|nr:Gfo/Idh/MocA family oxidoreductase [Candidatus Omnitrophota bacterium]
MKNSIRVAVIGAGKLGSKHAEVYSRLPGVDLVGVCDIDLPRAKEIARRCKTTAYGDHRALLGAVDAASIVVPSRLHHEISKEFLKSRAHILVEKPMTATLEEADDLLRTAAENGRLIQVGHIERFNSAIRTIRGIIRSPRFIECHRLGSYDPRVTDVGVTLDLMIHDIDIVLDLLRSPVEHVDAVGARILSKSEDIANARIRFANRCVCDLTASRVSAEVMRKIRIFQDDAYLSLDYVTQEALIYTKENGRIRHKKIDIKKSDSLKEELADFIDCARHERKPLVSGEEGREALALALEISRQISQSQSGN